jgi:AAA15 family ATPase/GTPase
LFPGIPIEASQLLKPSVFKDIEKELGYEILTYHKVFDQDGNVTKTIPFTIDKESSGTRSLFLLAIFLMDVIDTGRVLFIDEFEQNFHPLLVRSLITMFNNLNLNQSKAQLIFTTHDVSLLSNELFRRDQIWFTEKDEKGITQLYSMADVEGVRNNIPYDKWYLSGRFGATPIINDTQAYYGNVQKSR